MHELSLATSLVEQALAAMEQHKTGKILSLTVSVGALSGVDRGALEFCFPMACDGTPLEGAGLEIDEIPVKVRCENCGAESDVEIPVLICKNCESRNVSIISGRDFMLVSMEVESESEGQD